jgi:hypothetical protein
MILIDILKKIFRKRKKAVAPTPPIVVTPPKDSDATKPKIDPLTGEVIKDVVIAPTDPNLAIYSKIVQSLSNLVGIAGKVKTLRSTYQLKQINGNTSVADRFKFTNDNKIIEANYLKAKEDLIYAIKINCYQVETNYNLLTSFDLKTEVKNRYDALKTIFNDYGFLPLTSYLLIAPIKPIEIIKDSPVVVDIKPTTGGPQTQVGGNTPTTTTQTPVNDGRYPNWSNQFYSPNNTVYYQGHLYNSMTVIEGTNNDAPDRDGRWKLIL